jgi:hypothetical protein
MHTIQSWFKGSFFYSQSIPLLCRHRLLPVICARASPLRLYAATTGHQGNLTYFIYFPWPLVGAALSIFNVILVVPK